MTKQEYEKQRDEILAGAKNFIKDGKVDEANAEIEKAENLKTQYEEESRAAANIVALQGAPVLNVAPTQVVPTQATVGETPEEDSTNSMNYRKAFMNFVLNGTKMPANLGNVITTTEGGAVIPQTIVDRILEKMQSTGMILPLVTQTAYKGGVAIPVSLVKPEAEWVEEGADAVGKKLDAKKTGMITFSYFKLKVKVAVTLEMDVMAISAFETMISNNIAEAIVKGLETAIVNGSGTGQPKGILKSNVEEGQAITSEKTGEFGYKDLVTCEAALPLAYENGAVWCMSKKAFMAFIGMVDTNKQPIARVNYGLNGAPERTLLGRPVVLNEYVGFEKGSVVGFLFNFKDYVMNTNLGMTVKTYTDENTDDKVTKAVMLVDGKVVDNGSLVTLTLKA